MAGNTIRLSLFSSSNRNGGSVEEFSLVDEDGTEYTIDTLFRVLYNASRRIVEEVYREEHDGSKQGRD